MDGVAEPGKKEVVTSDDADAPGTTDGQQEQAEHVSFPHNLFQNARNLNPIPWDCCYLKSLLPGPHTASPTSLNPRLNPPLTHNSGPCNPRPDRHAKPSTLHPTP